MKKSTLKKLNIIIFLHNYVFPVWILCSLMTIGISQYCFLGTLVFMIATGVTYKKVDRIKNGRKILRYFRIALFLCISGLILPAIVLLSFDHTKCMYKIKRLDYTYGVFGKNAEYYKKLLPEKLPDECEEYSFITKGCMIAQDYHPSSCLMFCTDVETIEDYAEYYGRICDEIRVKDDERENEIKGIDWFCDNARIDESGRGEFKNAELYWINGNFPKGALLDKDSGYVVILT